MLLDLLWIYVILENIFIFLFRLDVGSDTSHIPGRVQQICFVQTFIFKIFFMKQCFRKIYTGHFSTLNYKNCTNRSHH